MTPDTAAAARIVDDVTRDQPRGLYLLAVHASLPAAVDAALLHHLRDNFLLDGPPAERLPVTPESEVRLARLLLSPLFAQVDSDLFEMVPAVRAVLLDELGALHGGRRLAEVAALLERYTVHTAPWADRPELQWAQRVSARVVSDPAAVDEWLVRAGAAQRSGLDDRWFVAMRARIDRDRDLAAAASRVRNRRSAGVEAAVRAALSFAAGEGDGPALFRILTGGLHLTTSPMPPTFGIEAGGPDRVIDATTLSINGADVVVPMTAVMAAGAGEALVLADPPGPDDTLFLVLASGRAVETFGVRFHGSGQLSVTVTADGPVDPFIPLDRSAVIDASHRLVGFPISVRLGGEVSPVWTVVDARGILDTLASRVEPAFIAPAVRTAGDGLLCLRLGETALGLGRHQQAIAFSRLAGEVLGDDPEQRVRSLILDARLATLAGGDLSGLVDEAHLLFDQLAPDSESGRVLAALLRGDSAAPAWLPPRLAVLVGRFDTVDPQVRNSNGVRAGAVAAAEVVGAMPADLTAGQVAELQSSPSPGARLLAAAHLQRVPDPAELWWLAVHVDPDTENPHVGYQAAVALRTAAEQLPSEHFDELEVALRQAGRPFADRPGSTRAAILDEAGATLARRRARTASSADLGWEEFDGLPDLNARYAVVRRIGISLSGRDVVVARERATGHLVVVRVGLRVNESRSAAVAAAIGGYPSRYVTGPVEWGHDGDTEFEIHDFVAGGSLADLRRDRPGRWPADQVEPVLAGLLDAVRYLHSRGVIHRNISPTSILVRPGPPPEMVLSGLDQAAMIGDSRFPTARLQVAYTAPEMFGGFGSPAADWWSVGIVLFDLLTGANPFRRTDAAWRHGDEIVRFLTVHDIDLSPVADRRWRSLLCGLLTRDPSLRWGPPEVRDWLAGRSPEAAAGRDPGMLFAGTVHTDARMLADAFRRNRDAARALVSGGRTDDPLVLALRDWATDLGLTATLRALTAPAAHDTTLPAVIAALDSDGRTPRVTGRPPDPVDVLVIAPRVAELAATTASGVSGSDGHPGITRWTEVVEGPTVYYSGRFARSDGTGFRVALTRSRPGETGDLLALLRPRTVAVTGACSGVPTDAVLGDVIVADPVIDGDLELALSPAWARAARLLTTAGLRSFGPATDEEAALWLLHHVRFAADAHRDVTRPAIPPETVRLPLVTDLVARGLLTTADGVPALTARGSEFLRVHSDTASPERLPVHVRVAPLAGGSAVPGTTRGPGAAPVAGFDPDVRGVAAVSGRPGTDWLVVKGVSDYGGAVRSERYVRFAARAAADVLWTLLARRPVGHDETR